MRAVVCRAWMPFVDLPLEDIAAPKLAAGQVRIATHYAGVSFATNLVTQGRYQRKPPFPFSPGTEVAGEIVEVAPDVSQFKPGDRVCAALDWGGHAEEAVAFATNVHRLPDALPFEVAPQFPLSYATSHATLSWVGRVTPGDWVLVHGAAGAVGLSSVEIAKAMGAKVIACASTPAKLEIARSHGADVVVNAAATDALEEIRAASGGGVDVVVDPVGGDAFDLSLRAVRQGGRIAVVGFAGGRIQQIPANILLVKNVAVLGFNYGRYIGWGPVDERQRFESDVRGQFADMFGWFAAGKLQPTTSHIFPLAAYRDAMQTVLARQGIGKVVLAMPRAARQH